MTRPTTQPQTATGRSRLTVAAIRAADIQAGDAITLPNRIYLPVRNDGESWTWIDNTPEWLTHRHTWRCVYENGDIDEHAYIGDLPQGFAVMRVSDHRPDQGQQHHSITLAPREFDLATIPIPAVLDPAPTTDH